MVDIWTEEGESDSDGMSMLREGGRTVGVCFSNHQAAESKDEKFMDLKRRLADLARDGADLYPMGSPQDSEGTVEGSSERGSCSTAMLGSCLPVFEALDLAVELHRCRAEIGRFSKFRCA